MSFGIFRVILVSLLFFGKIASFLAISFPFCPFALIKTFSSIVPIFLVSSTLSSLAERLITLLINFVGVLLK